MQKTILCYGDSNTWGWDPVTQIRLNRDKRWPGVLGNALGHRYWVVEEGLCGRTTVRDDPMGVYRNGRDYLIPCLQSHEPLDLVILMLGTNDLKQRFELKARDIAAGAETLVRLILKSNIGPDSTIPKVLLISPSLVTMSVDDEFEGAIEKSQELGGLYAQVATSSGVAFLDAARVVVPSETDGVHWDAEEHQRFGLTVADLVRKQLLPIAPV